MADRVSSEHPSVRTIRATCTETTTGVRLEIPAADTDAFPLEEVVRVVLDGEERFARIDRGLTDDQYLIRGIFATPDGARGDGGGPDLLSPWVDDHDVRIGGSVLVDVVEPDFLYGLREPGATTFYDAHEPPSTGLQDIARGLEDGPDS